MKRILLGFCGFFFTILFLMGCEEARTIYSGPDYIMFSDSLYVLPVQNNDDYFDIPVSATQACGYDRTLAVEIIDKNSNAIEGVHYTLESNTVTIKSGELVANVRVRGIYDNIEVTDSLGFALRLVTQENTQWDLYGIDANVMLKKTCPFNIYDFEGYCVVTSTYLYDYSTVDKRLIRTEVHPEEENTVILKDTKPCISTHKHIYPCRHCYKKNKYDYQILICNKNKMKKKYKDFILDKITLDFADNAAVCVVLASDGYPEKYEKGFPISGLETFEKKEGYYVFHAGTKCNDGVIVTNGGRVLGVTALGTDLKDARKNAYEATEWIAFDNKYKRNDIGKAIDEV